jgi:hypothetical protein
MAISNEEIYNQLRSKLLISKMHLDDHLVDIGQLIVEGTESAAWAIAKRDEAKRDYDYEMANTKATLREQAEKKLSESALNDEALLDRKVQKAIEELDTWRYDVVLWQGLVNGLEAHQSSLKSLVLLAGQGYFTIDSAAKSNREAMADARREAPPLRKRLKE